MSTNTGMFAELLAPGLWRILFNTIDMQPNQWLGIMNTDSSTRAYEEDFKVGGLGNMVPKPEGTNITFDDPLKGNVVRYTHQSFGLGFRVTREMWDDDLYNIIRQMPEELGRSASYKIEVDAWSVLNNAFNAGFVGEDGLALAHIAHTRLDGGPTIANRPAVDVDFSYTAYQAAKEHYTDLKDDRGRPQMMNGQLVIVSSQFQWAAKEILQSEYKPYTATNEINPLMSDGTDQFMVSKYLTDMDSWFYIAPTMQSKAGGGHDMRFWWRTKPETGSADDFLSGDALYKIFTRYSKGFSAWRGVYGSSGGA